MHVYLSKRFVSIVNIDLLYVNSSKRYQIIIICILGVVFLDTETDTRKKRAVPVAPENKVKIPDHVRYKIRMDMGMIPFTDEYHESYVYSVSERYI